MLIKIFLYWLPMIAIAFGNAMLREWLLAKYLTESRAHQLSTITLIILCAFYTWFILPLLNIESRSHALITGLCWMILTVAFEFTLGRMTNKTWSYLLQDYNLAAGRIWLLFLICLLFMPLFFSVLKKSF